MDGNRREGRAKLGGEFAGHRAGVERLIKVVEWSMWAGIRQMSGFSFSTENKDRPQEEINWLFDILREFSINRAPELIKKGVRIRFAGDRVDTWIPEDIRLLMNRLEVDSSHNNKLTLTICFNYGGQDEVLRAAVSAASQLTHKQCAASPHDILVSHLDTGQLEPVDLMVRTGGEKRISNFMLWQIAYAELVFRRTNWPAYSRRQFIADLWEFNYRQRRFGR